MMMDASEPQPRIRTLHKQDYAELIDMIRRMWHAQSRKETGCLAAQADWEYLLSRTTTAFVAELEGRPVAMILGRINALDHRHIPNTHHWRFLRAMGRLAFKPGGITALASLAVEFATDERLKLQTKRRWPAEVTLFLIAPQARGHGLGKRMFDTMMNAFQAEGISEYFLFTDSTCDVGFYDHRGLSRVAEQAPSTRAGASEGTRFYLYAGRLD